MSPPPGAPHPQLSMALAPCLRLVAKDVEGEARLEAGPNSMK